MLKFLSTATVAMGLLAASQAAVAVNGNLEGGGSQGAYGWACDPSTPAWKGNIKVVRGDGIVLAQGVSGIYREPAVAMQCGLNPNHGFDFTWAIPSNLMDDQNHYVHYYFQQQNGAFVEIPGSPDYVCFGDVISPQRLCR